MNSTHPLIRRIVERDLSDEEQKWINTMMSRDFPGRDLLLEQLSNVKVIGYCICGCKSVVLKPKGNNLKYPSHTRVPVEMIALAPDNVPIIFLLHVIDGYVCELEVFRADSKPLRDNEINLDQVQINT